MKQLFCKKCLNEDSFKGSQRIVATCPVFVYTDGSFMANVKENMSNLDIYDSDDPTDFHCGKCGAKVDMVEKEVIDFSLNLEALSKVSGFSVEEIKKSSHLINKKFILNYPDNFVTLPEYSAHRGQVVTVTDGLIDGEEYEGPLSGEPEMCEVTASDGWIGHVWVDELKPVKE